MIYPNIDCYYLCVWMLTISKQRLTGPQTTLTTVIRDAALNNTSVSVTEWNNFNQYAAWRNPYYLVYKGYQYSQVVSLLSGLTNYYNFQGNSNDLVGGINGVDTSVVYSNSYGLIGQGVRNVSTSSSIILGSVSSFNYIHQTLNFSINYWVRFSSLSNGYPILGSSSSPSEVGLFFTRNSTGASLLNFVNGSGNSYAILYNLSYKLINDLSYNMVSIIGDGVNFFIYVNGGLVAKGSLGSPVAGNASNALALFRVSGVGSPAYMDIDELGFWNRALNLAEINTLYNSGVGLTYPF